MTTTSSSLYCYVIVTKYTCQFVASNENRFLSWKRFHVCTVNSTVLPAAAGGGRCTRRRSDRKDEGVNPHACSISCLCCATQLTPGMKTCLVIRQGEIFVFTSHNMHVWHRFTCWWWNHRRRHRASVGFTLHSQHGPVDGGWAEALVRNDDDADVVVVEWNVLTTVRWIDVICCRRSWFPWGLVVILFVNLFHLAPSRQSLTSACTQLYSEELLHWTRLCTRVPNKATSVYREFHWSLKLIRSVLFFLLLFMTFLP